MSKKEICANCQTIGVYEMGLFGIEIKQVEYGIEDYILFVDYMGGAHRAKVHDETERFYFNFMGHRIHLDECIRV